MSRIKRAPTLSPGQLRHVLNVTSATSRHPERDWLAILMTHCSGVRCSELARLEVRDIVSKGGVLFQETQLRAEITKNCIARIIFLTHPKLRQALDTYLAHRLQKRLGCSLNRDEYLGLMPLSKLLLTHRGSGFELVNKRRTLPDGREKVYKACDALEARFRDLYRAAGFRTSSHCGRRSFASKLIKSGVDIERVAILLGHSGGIDVTAAYIEVDDDQLRTMYAEAL